MKRKLAVFDIDGTIFRWTFIAELMQHLSKKGIFPQNVIKQTEEVYFSWKDRRGSFDDYINTVVDVTNKALSGKSEREIDEAIQEMILHKKDNLYVYTRELIAKLKNDNYFLLAISASPEKIISEFIKFLGFDKYYGTIYEIKNGKYTGRELNEIYSKKDKILENFLKDYPLVTIKDSVGIGDSGSDIAFLKMVDNPIAFNPDRTLAEYAKENNWEIIVERKNVIYNVKDFTFE